MQNYQTIFTAHAHIDTPQLIIVGVFSLAFCLLLFRFSRHKASLLARRSFSSAAAACWSLAACPWWNIA